MNKRNLILKRNKGVCGAWSVWSLECVERRVIHDKLIIFDDGLGGVK